MRKKVISIVLTLLMILSACPFAFASETVPSDVAGTPYETAVSALVKDGIISGFTDGTFRPAAAINRASACVIAVKSMGASDAAVAAAPANGFKDLAGYDWAVKYINYAVSKGVISGYPNGTFRPGNEVTYNEMATMLVSTMGYKAADLTGTWPTNFYNKAKALGMLAGVPFKGDSPALRGYVAMMDYSVADQIAAANVTGTPTVPTVPTEADPAGILANYSGRAYGIVLSSATILNASGNTVQQLEFLLGEHTLYVNTKENNTANLAGLSAHLNAGDIYGLRMNNGIVNAVDTSDASFAGIGSPTGYSNLTIAAWTPVTARNNSTITLAGHVYTIFESASIYVAKVEGGVVTEYTVGSLSDIDAGTSQVRIYSVTGDEPGIAEVVLVKN